MFQRISMLALAVAVSIVLGWTCDARGDESPAQARSNNGVTVIADSAPMEVARLQAKPQVKEALTKHQPISITFKYGDEDPSLTCNVIDDRPITAATTVGSVLSKAASATTIFRPADSIVSVIRTQTTIGDDSRVEVAEQSLRVEWDLVSNRPTEATNYKLQPGDRILVWQPAPAPGQGFIKLAPKAPPTSVWVPTIPPPPEFDPYRPASVSYGAPPVAAILPMPPTAVADPPGMLVGQQQPVGANGESPTDFRYPSGAQPVAFGGPQPVLPGADLPFFGQLSVAQDPIEFHEYVEELTLPNGQKHAVQRRVPAQPQMMFKYRFINDPDKHLEGFAALRDKGLFIGDTETLRGALQILEQNKLISWGDGEAGCGGPLGQLVSGGAISERKNLDEATGETVPGDALEQLAEFTSHKNLSERLYLSFRIRYVLNGQAHVAQGASEFGRGQSLIARMEAEQIAGGENAKAKVKPRFVLITPEVVPRNDLPQAMPAPMQVAAMPIPTTMPSAASVLPAAAIANPGAVITDLAQKPQTRINYRVVQDVAGRLVEFLPPGQPPCDTVDSAKLETTVQGLLKKGLARQFTKSTLATISGEPANFSIENLSANMPDAPFDALHAEVVGESLRGGMSVELIVRLTKDKQKFGVAFSTLIAEGQSIIARIDSSSFKKAPPDRKQREDASEKQPTSQPVYIILSPEVAPL